MTFSLNNESLAAAALVAVVALAAEEMALYPEELLEVADHRSCQSKSVGLHRADTREGT